MTNVCKPLADAGIKITDAMRMKANAHGDSVFQIAMQRGDQSFGNFCKSLADAGIKITEKMLLQSDKKVLQYWIMLHCKAI